MFITGDDVHDVKFCSGDGRMLTRSEVTVSVRRRDWRAAAAACPSSVESVTARPAVSQLNDEQTSDDDGDEFHRPGGGIQCSRVEDKCS